MNVLILLCMEYGITITGSHRIHLVCQKMKNSLREGAKSEKGLLKHSLDLRTSSSIQEWG